MEDNQIELDNLKEIEEFESILNLYNRAKKYLESYSWCRNVIKGWYALGVYEKIGVFLFNIEPKDESVDDFIWIIIGDLPTVYLDKSVPNANEALKDYCILMSEWANNIIEGKSIEECYPVEAAATVENSELLKKRIAFIEKNLINT